MQSTGQGDVLTSDAKARIREEEVFRQEIRRDIERSADGARSGALRFFNSALGLWLLSTVVVGLVSWNYTQWAERRSRDAQKAELVRKLDLEIANRVETLSQLLNSVVSLENFQMTLQLSEKPNMGLITFYVLPEFESRGLRSLLWELQSLVPPSEKPEITKALKAAQELAKLRMNAVDSTGTDDVRKLPVAADLRAQVTQVLDHNLRIARWRVP